VPHRQVLDFLETIDEKCIAVLRNPAGAINSALFCQEVVLHLLHAFPGRFRIVEETKVEKIIVRGNGVILDCGGATIEAGEIVLCTNGYEDFTIVADNGLCLDKEFHRNVESLVGYMSAYLVPMNRPPTGLVFLGESWTANRDDYYYYLSRRPYEYESGLGARHNLVSIGGPQMVAEDRAEYSQKDIYPPAVSAEIENFVQKTFGTDAPKWVSLKVWLGWLAHTRHLHVFYIILDATVLGFCLRLWEGRQ
jgi:glycine/D-amino acid oxidase-like deaminating enzyme